MNKSVIGLLKEVVLKLGLEETNPRIDAPFDNKIKCRICGREAPFAHLINHGKDCVWKLLSQS